MRKSPWEDAFRHLPSSLYSLGRLATFHPLVYWFDNIICKRSSWLCKPPQVSSWAHTVGSDFALGSLETFGFSVFACRCLLVLLTLPTLDERLENYLKSILPIYLMTNQRGTKAEDKKNKQTILGVSFTGNSAILAISCRRAIEKNKKIWTTLYF